MATSETLSFNDAHPPRANSIEAFDILLPTLKSEIVKSRHHWDAHEPRMWSRAQGLSDHELVDFKIEDDLVEVNFLSEGGPLPSRHTLINDIRLPKVNDAEGEGFVHVRIHDPPNRGSEDVLFHSLFTNEFRESEESTPIAYRAIQVKDKPLEFFNE